MCFGNLNRDVATYGLSYLNLNRALSNTWWNNACRLSELNTKKHNAMHSLLRQKSMIEYHGLVLSENPLSFRKEIQHEKEL